MIFKEVLASQPREIRIKKIKYSDPNFSLIGMGLLEVGFDPRKDGDLCAQKVSAKKSFAIYTGSHHFKYTNGYRAGYLSPLLKWKDGDTIRVVLNPSNGFMKVISAWG